MVKRILKGFFGVILMLGAGLCIAADIYYILKEHQKVDMVGVVMLSVSGAIGFFMLYTAIKDDDMF